MLLVTTETHHLRLPRPPGWGHYFQVRYEAWQDDEDGGGVVFLPDDDKKEHQLGIALVGKRELVWSVEANSWEEAMTAWHEHNGWEPYVPMDLESEPPKG